ncbi:hypothetical protein V7112_14480 [Bacillus sp. JJ1566]|uniref:hypothetical protein n=1 Tax=Bacillus sp. JJ1566 TaxID=3122961 RepID=UPI002FFD9F3B
MNEIDIAMTIYVIFMIVSIFVSFKYGSTMIIKTGLFLPQALIAGTINLCLGVIGILGWFFFSWSVNEILFFGGLALGVGLLALSEIVLFSILFSKRKRWIQLYNDDLNYKN